MDDPEELTAIKHLVACALNLCTDFDTLDLVYKLLASDSCAAQ